MKLLTATPTVICLALLSAAVLPIARADDYDKRTVVTFSIPVEIPASHIAGMGVLPPGTYVFKLAKSSSNRHIVQIFNEDGTKIYATILAIPNYRLRRTSKTVITFNEGLTGKPEALHAWFYPGDNWGEEFVYPKSKAEQLAEVTNVPVLALVADVKEEVAKPDEPEVVQALVAAPVMAVRPTGEVVEIAQVVQATPPDIQAAAAPADAPAPDPVLVADNRLPNTASSLPLIALCGLLALAGGFTIRALRNRAL